MKRTASIAFKFVGVIVVIATLAAGYLAWAWNRPLNPGSEIYLVKPGTGLRALANEFSRRRVIPESVSFVMLGYIVVPKRDFKAGEYQFRDGMSARAILTQVAAGHVVEYPVRLLEGWTFQQVREELESAPRLAQTLAGLSKAEIMQRMGAPGVHPEGRFFPDTYFYTAGSNDLSILQRAYAKMQARLRQEWESRDTNVPFATADEALILASIVEKETGRSEERGLVAGVFINRLNKRIRLQTDPTVVYGLGEKYDGRIHKRDLLTDTPYNTYTRYGLPPTPIAMPGVASLHATLHPEQTNALYFVARGDGSHEFSDTLTKHNQAVSKYQLGGKPFPATPLPPTKPAGKSR